jgi:photosystem II stability/assembly factor-like uncharacterized protein
MRSQREILASVLLASMVASVAIAQEWTPTSAPAYNWSCLASSADGRKLVVGNYSGGQIYVSTNFGSTWTSANSPTNYWNAVACSADGSVIIASGIGPSVYVSRDSGATWPPGAFSPSVRWISSVACSADGKRMVVASAAYAVGYAVTNAVYISTNSGVDWVWTSAPKGGRLLPQVTMSADGSRLAVATGTSSIETSTNFGLTWTPAYPTAESMYHEFVATSGEGASLIAVSTPTNLSSQWLISMSSDWGATWRQVESLTNPLNEGASISAACSADGVTLVVAESPANGFGDTTALVLSTNSGASWTTQLLGSTNLCSVVSSVDGSRLAAALGHWPGPTLYVRQTTPVPLLKILSGPGSLALSWLLPSEPFVLEESPDLLTWSQADATPTLNYTNLHYVANLPAPIAPKFYRLLSQ